VQPTHTIKVSEILAKLITYRDEYIESAIIPKL
jgi:hypothetical protein